MSKKTDRTNFKLRNLKVRRVDHVDNGANQESHIVFYKSDGSVMQTANNLNSTLFSATTSSFTPTIPPPRTLTELREAGQWDEVQKRLDDVSKHYGPGPHADGSPQSVHGGKGGSKPKPLSAKQKSNRRKIQRQNYAGSGHIPQARRSKEEQARRVAELDANYERWKETEEGKRALSPKLKFGKAERPPMSTQDTIKKVFAAVTKGLIEGGVFVETATPEEFGDILPQATVDELSKILSAESANPKEHTVFNTESLPEEAIEYIKSLEASVEELTEALDASDIPDDSDTDPIEKALDALPPEVARILKADRESARVTQAALATEIEKRHDDEYIAKVAVFKNVVAEVDNVGKALRRLSESAPEDAALFEGILKDASVRLEEAGLFNEIGKSLAEGADGDAYGKATAIAKSLVEKGDAVSIEDGRAQAWERNPELYQEYQEERSAR